MRIAVLSGKGGAGKTMVSVNLALAAKKSTYIDCDVEEPNGRLFLKPDQVTESGVHTLLPVFDKEKCTGCRKCVEFCRFNALIYIKDAPVVFDEVCHSCGGCSLVCPEGAVEEMQHCVGHIKKGTFGDVNVITGELNIGESSGVPVIKAALDEGFKDGGMVIIDCPPGSACSVMESVTESDYCVLVTEPTAFGFHNFKMVHELVSLLGKKCGVVINRMEEPYEPLEEFCKDQGITVLGRLPYSGKAAGLISEGKLLYEEDSEFAKRFDQLLANISKEAGGDF